MSSFFKFKDFDIGEILLISCLDTFAPDCYKLIPNKIVNSNTDLIFSLKGITRIHNNSCCPNDAYLLTYQEQKLKLWSFVWNSFFIVNLNSEIIPAWRALPGIRQIFILLNILSLVQLSLQTISNLFLAFCSRAYDSKNPFVRVLGMLIFAPLFLVLTIPLGVLKLGLSPINCIKKAWSINSFFGVVTAFLCLATVGVVGAFGFPVLLGLIAGLGASAVIAIGAVAVIMVAGANYDLIQPFFNAGCKKIYQLFTGKEFDNKNELQVNSFNASYKDSGVEFFAKGLSAVISVGIALIALPFLPVVGVLSVLGYGVIAAGSALSTLIPVTVPLSVGAGVSAVAGVILDGFMQATKALDWLGKKFLSPKPVKSNSQRELYTGQESEPKGNSSSRQISSYLSPSDDSQNYRQFSSDLETDESSSNITNEFISDEFIPDKKNSINSPQRFYTSGKSEVSIDSVHSNSYTTMVYNNK